MLAYTLQETISLLNLLTEAEQIFRADPEQAKFVTFLQGEITKLQFRLWEHEQDMTEGKTDV